MIMLLTDKHTVPRKNGLAALMEARFSRLCAVNFKKLPHFSSNVAERRVFRVWYLFLPAICQQVILGKHHIRVRRGAAVGVSFADQHKNIVVAGIRQQDIALTTRTAVARFAFVGKFWAEYYHFFRRPPLLMEEGPGVVRRRRKMQLIRENFYLSQSLTI